MALAWVLSSHPDSSIRRPDEAIELARLAVELTNRDPSALDALAAACAAAGRFEEAVTAASEPQRSRRTPEPLSKSRRSSGDWLSIARARRMWKSCVEL